MTRTRALIQSAAVPIADILSTVIVLGSACALIFADRALPF